MKSYPLDTTSDTPVQIIGNSRHKYTPRVFTCPNCGRTVMTWTHLESCLGNDEMPKRKSDKQP